MGTTDHLPERELYQGLIKLAAAFVHGVRGNPPGIARNLEGARPHLAEAEAAGMTGGLDLVDLLARIDERLADAPRRRPDSTHHDSGGRPDDPATRRDSAVDVTEAADRLEAATTRRSRCSSTSASPTNSAARASRAPP